MLLVAQYGKDNLEFITAGSIWARRRNISHQPPHTLSPSPVDPGHTSLWILSSDFFCQKITVIFTIVDRFSKPVFDQQLQRLLNSRSNTSSVYMESLLTLFQTKDHSSFLWCGWHFVKLWVKRPGCLLVITLRPMGRWNGPIRTWSLLSDVWQSVTWPPGSNSSQGSSMPTIHSSVPPQVCPHSWLPWDINFLSFPPKKWSSQFLQSRVI